MSRAARIGTVELLVAGQVKHHAIGQLLIETGGPGFTEITAAVSAFVAETGIRDGLVALFCRHTSASLTIQENADSDVQADLETALDHLAPRNAAYRHGIEGPDDMPAHIKSMITGASLSTPVLSGQLALGRWQGIYLIEHRNRPHRREVLVNLYGT
jgi:secondary thiamine-phosphate synthase enzyme